MMFLKKSIIILISLLLLSSQLAGCAEEELENLMNSN